MAENGAAMSSNLCWTKGLLAAAILLLAGGCAAPQKSIPAAECNTQDPRDLIAFPQAIGPYLSNARERSSLLPIQRRYKSAFYQVWQNDYVPEPLSKVKWPYEVYTSEEAYGANLRPLPQTWFYAMMREADWQHYGSIGKPAIALKRLNLRNFPTEQPLFRNPCVAGEGFPFDYLQNSAVFANEPLYLSHFSKSGAWAYVLTSYATGWVRADTIALINADRRRSWQRQPLLALLDDNVPLHTVKNDYLFETDVGMVLPERQRTSKGYTADAAIPQGIRSARVIQAPLGADAAAPIPMRFSAASLKRVITPVMQTKYGWGGLYGERDCSSTLRDIFAPFGIWLPRNSYQQAAVGRIISFEGLDDEAKLEKIKTEGKPFETLLYLKGHILLYLGLYHGEAAVLHTIWGIKTVNANGDFGRHIVGKTVISSLRLGKELEGYREQNSLLHKLESMNFILEEGVEE